MPIARSTVRPLVGLTLLAGLAVSGRLADGQDADSVPPAVAAALQRMVAAQRAGNLQKYADTLASPVGPVFRQHADSAIKIGEAKRRLEQVIHDKFGPPADAHAFDYAFDDTQLAASLRRLVSMQITDSAPSGNNWKVQVTSTVRMPDGTTRQIPQGFIAVQYGADWKVQDLAVASHLAGLRQGAEMNWTIYRMFNQIADETANGKFHSGDQPAALAKAAYDQITNKNAPPPQGRDEYLAAEKAFAAGDFATSFALFRQSADKGFPHAAFMVGYQYSLGEGVPEDPKAAFEWMKKDAVRHDATALNFLGSKLLEGDGVAANPAEGIRLLNAAAEQDQDAAILNLGRAYLFGLGVPKDEARGRALYARSAELGNEQAAYFVKWLGQSPGNRSFKDQNQATAFQQIQLLRANALAAEQSGWKADGTYRAANPQLAAQLRAQADELARANGLE